MLIRKAFAVPLLSAILTIFPAFAHADCAAPGSPGLRICFPSQYSTVMYTAGIEMAATTASGAVARVEVWDNGTKRETFQYLPGTLYDGSMRNGWNRVTVKLWDTDGNLYQAQRSFYVTGYGVGTCSTPGTAGVNLCWPRPNSSQPNEAVPISATAKGQNSKIRYVNIYVDGKFLVGQSGQYIVTGASMSAGTHTVTARAVDYAGNVFKASSTFKTFFSYDCNPRTGACSPGIVINQPGTEDVPATFTVQADVQNNPAPISTIKIYMDDVVKASSSGPGITASMTLPVNTTHRIVIKAWDTSGQVYESYQNLYVH
ncbi:MAG TPA: Ig-like domain-containing protein [Terriglobales bacterium]|nr:Ig-like domain-containing protein [Terriglobales bacterium]